MKLLKNNKEKFLSHLLSSSMVLSLLFASVIGLFADDLNYYHNLEISDQQLIEQNKAYQSEGCFSSHVDEIEIASILSEAVDSEEDDDDKKHRFPLPAVTSFQTLSSLIDLSCEAIIYREFELFFDKAIYLRLCSLKIPS